MRHKSPYRFSIHLEGVPKALCSTCYYNGTIVKVHRLGLESNPRTFIWTYRGKTKPVRVQYKVFERILKNVYGE